MGKHNLNIPEDKKLHDLATLDLLADLPLPAEASLQMGMHMEEMRMLHQQIKDLEKSIHPQLIPNPDVPRIGRILAFTILS